MATKLMRKYSKPMMAVLGVLLMVTFLVGYSYQSGMGGSGDAFVLGKFNGHPLTKGQLTQARIDIRILRNLPALANIGLYPMWLSHRSDTRAAIQFYLLGREARAAGFFPDNGDISLLVKQKAVRKEIGALLANSNYAQPNVIEALADLTTIDQMQLFVSGSCLPSSPQLAHFISELGTSVQVRYVRMRAADTADTMPKPTLAELQSLFAAYRTILPWNASSPPPPPLIDGHRYPFGYRYPNRVKIEFLKFDRDAVLAKLKPTIGDIQAAYAYYQSHQDKFEITPADKTSAASKPVKPVYKTFDQVRRKLIRRQLIKRVDLLFHRMLNRADHRANKPWHTVDVDGYHKPIPESKWVSYKVLAEDLGRQYGYTPVVGRWNHWLDAVDLSSLRGIGEATTDQAGLPQAEGLGVLAMKVHTLDPKSKNIGLLLHLQVGFDGPVLTDAHGNKYLYRIIAVSKSHNPATLAPVRSEVMHDARLLAAYQADIKSGQVLADQAARLGLPASAKAEHLVVYTPSSFKALENKLVGISPDGQPQYQIVPGHLPGVMVRSGKLMQAAFMLAHKALANTEITGFSSHGGASLAGKSPMDIHGQTAARLIITHPCASVALDPQLEVFVMQLAKAKPVPVNILHNSADLAGAGGYLMRSLNQRLLQQWFSYAAVAKRTGFVANDQEGAMSRIDKIFWDTLRGPKQWISAWFAAYTLLGAVSSGLIPILLPLMMVRLLPHELAAVGYVMGAFNFGALSSPLWGNVADARKAFRLVFCGGLLLELMAMALFPLAANLGIWLLLALLMGAGSAAVSTCATLLIVEFYPQAQWTSRIGWLQTFNGAGQVIGLLLAGAFVTIGYKFGLWMGAGLLVVAIAVGLIFLPRPSRGGIPTGTAQIPGLNLDFESLARFARVELIGGGMLKHLHFLNIAGLKNIPRLLPTRFGRFLVSWFFVFLGVAGFFAYFPIFLKQSFGVLPATTSLTYALAAGIGIALYNLAGVWAQKIGAQKIYFFGRILRFTGFVLLLVPLLIHTLPGSNFIALLGFAVVVLAWPILSVTGTELTSELSPISQGAAQGLNNAANGVGTVTGTYLAGWLVHVAGYKCIPIMALVGLALSVLVDTSFRRSKPVLQVEPAPAV